MRVRAFGRVAVAVALLGGFAPRADGQEPEPPKVEEAEDCEGEECERAQSPARDSPSPTPPPEKRPPPRERREERRPSRSH